jgi:hypothetical protein
VTRQKLQRAARHAQKSAYRRAPIVAGFLLEIWFASMLVVALFDGAARSLIGISRRTPEPQEIVPHTVALAIWTDFLCLCVLGLAYFWDRAFEYLRTSGGFNFGQAIGTVWAIAHILFSSKTSADLIIDIESFVRKMIDKVIILRLLFSLVSYPVRFPGFSPIRRKGLLEVWRIRCDA